jgi:hypothetical protein
MWRQCHVRKTAVVMGRAPSRDVPLSQILCVCVMKDGEETFAAIELCTVTHKSTSVTDLRVAWERTSRLVWGAAIMCVSRLAK